MEFLVWSLAAPFGILLEEPRNTTTRNPKARKFPHIEIIYGIVNSLDLDHLSHTSNLPKASVRKKGLSYLYNLYGLITIWTYP